MSTILEVLRRSRRHVRNHAPLLRIQCAGCGRIYEAISWKKHVLRRTACQACRPRFFTIRAAQRKAAQTQGGNAS